MKIGHVFPVSIEGHVVGDAVVEYIEDGVATILIPQTRIMMQLTQHLAGVQETGGSETLLLGNENTISQPPGEPSEAATQQIADATPVPGTTLQAGDVGEGIHGKKLDSSVLDD